jgi:hypothetical protein
VSWPVCEGCKHRVLRTVWLHIRDYRGVREERITAYVCELGEDRDRNPYECPYKEVLGREALQPDR